MSKSITISQPGGSRINASIDKSIIKLFPQVVNHNQLYTESNWGMVSFVYKHTLSSRRLVASFKGNFDSETTMKIRSGMNSGDEFHLKKIIISGPGRQPMLVLSRSQIENVAQLDFILGAVDQPTPSNFSVSLSSSAPSVVGGAYSVSVLFGKSVTGFSLSDIAVSGGATLSGLSGSGASYSFQVNPSSEGIVSLNVISGSVSASDGSTNLSSNIVQKTYSVPATASLYADSNSFSGPFTVTASFNKPIIGFELTDLSITNGVASNLTGSGANYSFTVTPIEDGAVSLSINSDSVSTLFGNTNSGSNSLEVQYSSPATVTLTTSSEFASAPFNVSVTFSKPVTGFELTDLSITNGVASNLTGSGANYSFTVTPSADGQVSVNMPSGAAIQGPSGENNLEASNVITTTYVDLKTLTLDTAAGDAKGSVSAYLNNEFVFSSKTLTASQIASYDFQLGSSVQLRAKAGFNNYFAGYSGAINSSEFNSNVTMDSNKTVAAAFNKSFNETFRIDPLSSTSIVKVKALSNGKIALHGDILSFDGTNSRGLIMLNSDLTIDENFAHGGFNGQVNDVLLENGNIWVVGNFTTYFGPVSSAAAAKGLTSGTALNANRVAKLNSNGVLQLINASDQVGQYSNGFSDTVNCVATDAMGNIWFGGMFGLYFGGNNYEATSSAMYIAKINSSGVLQKVSPGDTDGFVGFNAPVYAIKMDTNGNMWIGGDFKSYYGDMYNGQRIAATGETNNANGLAKLNMSGVLQKISAIDVNSSTGNGFAFTATGVRCINFDSNGNVWVGGGFERYYGQCYPGGSASYNANYIAKLNSSGVLEKINANDSPGTTGNGFWTGPVRAIEFDFNGNTWVGGDFVHYKASSGNNANRIAKFNSLGDLVKINTGDLNGSTGNGFNNPVHSISMGSNNSVWVGGTFSTSHIATASNLKLQTPNACLLQYDLDVNLIPYHYNDYSLHSTRYITQRGLESLSLTSPFNSSSSDSYKTKLLPSGKLAIFGNFTIVKNGQTWRNFAILDIQSNSDFQLNSFFPPCQFNAAVNDVVEDSSGNIWVGGNFTTFTGTISSTASGAGFVSGATNNANRIAKLNSSGVLQLVNGSDLPTAAGNGFDNDVECMTLSNNTLWVGGGFLNYRATSGNNANRIARINTSNGTLSTYTGELAGTLNNGFSDGRVFCITIIGATAWVGGSFTRYKSNNLNANRIARINTSNGTLSRYLGDSDGSGNNGFNGPVRCITDGGDGFVWVGGRFGYYKSTLTSGAGNANLIAKINAFTGVLTKINSGDGTGTGTNGFDGILVYTSTSLGVSCITKDSQGNIWVGGNFTSYVSAQAWGGRNTSYTNQNARKIAKINQNGEIVRINTSNTNTENGFGFNSGDSATNEVLSIVEIGQDIYVSAHKNLNRYLGEMTSVTSFPTKANNLLIRPFIKLYNGNSIKIR